MCAGNDFVVLLTSDGTIYTIGSGTRGQLGVSPMCAATTTPMRVDALADTAIRIVDVVCGGWHTIVLTGES